jgi:uncharacterized protein HemY
MLQEEHCKKLENIAYKSCLDSYFLTKDKEDIKEYWIQLFNKKRYCEARGVEKALELINLYEEIRAKD